MNGEKYFLPKPPELLGACRARVRPANESPGRGPLAAGTRAGGQGVLSLSNPITHMHTHISHKTHTFSYLYSRPLAKCQSNQVALSPKALNARMHNFISKGGLQSSVFIFKSTYTYRECLEG